MKTLDRYLIVELVVPFLVGTLAVVLMFLANQLIFEFKNISVQHVPLLAIVQLLVYKIPAYLKMTLPVGMSLAAALSYSRLTRESELTAMRVAGTSILRAVAPAVAFGLAVGLLNYVLVEKIMPKSEKAFRTIAVKIGVLATIPNFSSNAMVKLRDSTMSIGSVSRGEGDVIQLTNILMVERPRVDEATLVTADRGEYRNGIWTLHNALVRAFKGDDLISARPRHDVLINDKILLQDLFLPPSPEEETAAELMSTIKNMKKFGANSAEHEIEFHSRYAIPAACFIFALVSPIFAILFARSGGFVGVLVSIIVVFLYWNVFVISTQILGTNHVVPPIVAAWLPNALFACMGVLGLRRLE